MKAFRRSITKLFKPTRCPSNLMPHQAYLLDSLQTSENLLITCTNKNLGPAIINRTTYIVLDTKTYKNLSPNEAASAMAELKTLLTCFVSVHQDELGKNNRKFLLNSMSDVKDPYPHFYLMFKSHKTPFKMRPIALVSGSLLHALGCWLKDQLQPLVLRLPLFLASSWDLRKCLKHLPPLPAHARCGVCVHLHRHQPRP
jgi:hypothetical protein